MKPTSLIFREIRYRKLAFVLGLIGVVAAVACVLGELVLLRAHDLRTDQILAARQTEAKLRLAVLEDEMRKAMKDLGYNILILPKDQKLADFWEAGFADKTMPREYAKKLSDASLVMIQHLTPMLERKARWPEQNRTILLVGTQGKAPLLQRGVDRPVQAFVEGGQIALGYELWTSLNLKPGDPVTLMGRKFTVNRCHAEQGSVDDIAAYIDLRAAQEMLDLPGRINAIQALKCVCAGVGVERVIEEISKVLPDTQIKEIASKATAREKARDLASEETHAALEQERAGRDRLRQAREQFAAVLLPLAVAGGAAWVALLAMLNVRQRQSEIGILRAIGMRRGQIFWVFLGRALAQGLLGAVVGVVAGVLVAAAWSEADVMRNLPALLPPGLWAGVLFGAPVLACLASWAPATLAASQDPAAILGVEG